MLWDDATQKVMMTLWNDEGLSASDIASRLNKQFGKDMTRNSVVAKAWRLRAQGVAMRGRSVLTPAANRVRKGKLPHKLRKPQQPQVKARSQLEMAIRAVPFRAANDDSKPTVMSVSHLEAQHCRWPIGNVGEPEFGFCGQERFMGLPYCAHHAAIGYQAPQPAQRGEAAIQHALPKPHAVEYEDA